MRKIWVFTVLISFCVLLAFSTGFSEENRIVSFDAEQYIVYIGKTQKIKATVENVSDDAPKKTTLIWISSDETIAKVSSDGTVKGIHPGIVTITAQAKDDELIEHSATVEIRVPVSKINVVPAQVNLLIGADKNAAQAELRYEITPEDAFHQDVIWSSSNEAVATVDQNGVVTALTKGTATITAKSNDPSTDRKAVCKVSVAQAVTELSLDKESLNLPVSKSVAVKATIGPNNAGNKKLLWSSADDSIAKVSSSGIVQGISPGITTITASTSDGSAITASLTVNVVSPVKKIVFEDKGIELAPDTIWQPSITVLPEEATIKDIVWFSSNTKVAMVEQDGTITGISKGTANITAAAIDGSGVKATIQVKVNNYDMVFTDNISQTACYYYGSGQYKVRGKNTTGCVQIPEIDTSMYAIIFGGLGSEEFQVTPIKPGSDVITITAGSTKTVIKAYVSQTAFTNPSLGTIIEEGKLGIYNGHTYQIIDEKCTWKQAKKNCEEAGGHLVTITSWKEQKFIESLNNTNKVLWIGLQKNDKEVWGWVTDEDLVYTHWGDGEPNNYRLEKYPFENAVGIRPMWCDYHEDNIADFSGYIIEWDFEKDQNNQYLDETIPAEDKDFADFEKSENKLDEQENIYEFEGHGYKVFEEYMTWDKAKKYCEDIGGHLVTIESEQENDFLTSLLGRRNLYWIGLKLDEDDECHWVTDEPVTYTNFHVFEPDNYLYNQGYCMLVNNDWELWKRGEWGDMEIDGVAWDGGSYWADVGFICEWENK